MKAALGSALGLAVGAVLFFGVSYKGAYDSARARSDWKEAAKRSALTVIGVAALISFGAVCATETEFDPATSWRAFYRMTLVMLAGTAAGIWRGHRKRREESFVDAGDPQAWARQPTNEDP